MRHSDLQGDASPVRLKTKVPENNVVVGLYFPTSFQVRHVHVICFGQWQESSENFKRQSVNGQPIFPFATVASSPWVALCQLPSWTEAVLEQDPC